MTDSKIESAKKLLASGVPPKDVAKNLGVSIPTLYAGCQPLRTLSVRCFPFSETTPRWGVADRQYHHPSESARRLQGEVRGLRSEGFGADAALGFSTSCAENT